jgi:dolichol kinase
MSLMQDPKISSDIYTYFIASALLAPLFLLQFWIISVLCMKLLSPLASVAADWLFRLVSQGGEAGQTAAGRIVQFAASLVAFYLLLTFILLPAGLHQG